MKRVGIILFVAIGFIGFSHSVDAQSVSQQIGLKPYGSYAGGQIDHVDLESGNLFLHVPLFSLPQLGKLKLSYSISLNSNSFRLEEAYDPITGVNFNYYDKPDPLATQGPTIDFDQDVRVVYTGHSENDVAYQNNTDPIAKVWPSFSTIDFAGSQHSLGFENGSKVILHSSDGSGFTFSTPADDGQLWGMANDVQQDLWDWGRIGVLTDPSGIKYNYDSTGTTISDPSGNAMHFSAGTNLVDSIGRSISDINTCMNYCASWPNAFSSSVSGCPNLGVATQPAVGSITWTVPGPNGSSQNYLICFTTVTYHTAFVGGSSQYPIWDGPTAPDGNAGPPYMTYDAIGTDDRIQAVVLPDSSYWGFIYDSSGNYDEHPYPNYDANDQGTDVPIAYGDLVQLIYPMGATISYSYGPFNGGDSAAHRVVSTRTTDDHNGNIGKWKYSLVVPNSTYTTGTSVATDPLGNDTVHHYAVANNENISDPQAQLIETETDWFNGSQTSGQVMKSTSSQYQSVADPVDEGWWNSPDSVASLRVQSTTSSLGGVSSTTNYGYVALFTDSELICRYWNGLQGTVSCIPQGTSPTIYFSQPSRSTTYGYDGTVVEDMATTFQFTSSSAYQQANLLNLPASVARYDANQNTVAQTSYGYDEDNGSPQGVYGNATSASVWLNTTGQWLKTSNVYNGEGMPTQEIDARKNATLITYDNTGIFPATIQQPTTNGVQHIDSYTWDANTGNTLSHTDQNEVQTQYYYDDPLGRITQIRAAVNTSAETWTTYAYPGSTLVTTAADQNTKGDGILQSSTTYDGFWRPIHESYPGGITTDTTYDALGRVIAVSNPHVSSASVTDGTTSFAYDALGRKLFQCQPDNGTGMAPCTPSASYLKWTYANNAVDAFDESGTHTRRTYDALGKLAQVLELGTQNAPMSFETYYIYDWNGNLSTVSQLGAAGDVERIRSFTYDSLSRLIQDYNPESGWTCYGTTAGAPPNGSNCTAGYDENGNQLYKTDAYGILLQSYYDPLNRVSLVTSPQDGELYHQFTYDQGEYGIGRLSQVFDQHPGNVPDSGTQFSFDPMGHVTRTSWFDFIAAAWKTGIGAQYDHAGEITQLTYPDTRVISQTWLAGRLTSVFDGTQTSPGLSYISGIQYTASGALTLATYGSGTAPFTQSVTFNDRLEPCHEAASTPLLPINSSGGNLLDRQLFYGNNPAEQNCADATDNNGNIWSIIEGPGHNTYQNFNYDALNRLTASFSGNRPTSTSYSFLYHYDSFGNMIPIDQLHAPMNYGIDTATNRLTLNGDVNTGDLQYYANGNLKQAPSGYGPDHILAYTAEGYLRSIDNYQVGSYLTNGLGERTLAVHNNQTWNEYVYLNGQPMADLDNTGNWTDYIYANGQKIAKTDSSEDVIHFHGNSCSGCSANWAATYFSPGVGYQIQNGDKLTFKQRQLGIVGGMYVHTSQGGDSAADGIVDQNGNNTNFSNASDGLWHDRIVDLSSFQGQTISAIGTDTQGGLPANNWDLYYADIAILSQNGTITPIFNGQPSFAMPIWGPNGSAVLSATVDPVTTDSVSDGKFPGAHYYLADQLGTTQVELSGGGWPVWQGWFTPFGQEIINGGEQNVMGGVSPDGTSNRYKFTGKERDTESGLDYFGARYYASATGRWMRPDLPLVDQDASNPQSWNLYGYVRNNPVSRIDNDGRLTIIIPGTWYSATDWTYSHSPLTSEAQANFNDPAVGFLYWSGQNSDAARIAGAQQLRQLIAAYHFAPGEKLNIITHSHGGNVALAAAHLGLAHKIDNLITLGAPNLSPEAQYQAPAGTIGKWYNITASMDMVQSTASDDVPNAGIQAGAENHQVNSVTWNPISAHSELWDNPHVRNEWWGFYLNEHPDDPNKGGQNVPRPCINDLGTVVPCP